MTKPKRCSCFLVYGKFLDCIPVTILATFFHLVIISKVEALNKFCGSWATSSYERKCNVIFGSHLPCLAKSMTFFFSIIVFSGKVYPFPSCEMHQWQTTEQLFLGDETAATNGIQFSLERYRHSAARATQRNQTAPCSYYGGPSVGYHDTALTKEKGG